MKAVELLRNLGALSALACAATAQAQFSGPPAYTFVPSSAMGANTGSTNLVLNTLPNGFDVTGQFTVTLTGPISGTLASWTIDRPIAAFTTVPAFQTSTVLDGFSLPPGPPNVAGSTFGLVATYVIDTSVPGAVVPNSRSSIPISLVNGAATWLLLSNLSPAFPLVTGPSTSFVLRQEFWLDGILSAGPGGNWLIDVPVFSTLAPVPEPATALMLALGLGLLLARRGQGARRSLLPA